MLKLRQNKQKINSKKGFIPTPILLLELKNRSRNFVLEYINLIKSIFKYQNRSKRTRANLVSGFTLVELLVTIVIFVIITGVVLVNSNRFDSSVLLNNFAYDVALTIKQAQSYGVNVKENSFGNFNSANESYGIYFDTSIPENRTRFVLFNDNVNQSEYNIGNPTTHSPDLYYNGLLNSCPADSLECIQKFTMTKGTYIKSMCAGGNEADCALNQVDQLSILFKRPKLDAKIYINRETDPSKSKQYAKITLAASDGSTIAIVVTSVGQIYVKK